MLISLREKLAIVIASSHTLEPLILHTKGLDQFQTKGSVARNLMGCEVCVTGLDVCTIVIHHCSTAKIM